VGGDDIVKASQTIHHGTEVRRARARQDSGTKQGPSREADGREFLGQNCMPT
jgi:hypothetical protein